MKKFLHITGLISIALFYSLAIGLYSGVAYAGNGSFSTQDGHAEKKYSNTVAAKLFQHTIQSENAVTVCGHSKPATIKNTCKEFSAINKAAEQVYVHTFLRYNFFSRKLLVRLQNTDLIFPFHYFW